MAHIPRLYVPNPLASASEFELAEGQARYLIKVMRLSDGATVRAFNGKDGEWNCTLRSQGKRGFLAPATQTRPQENGSNLHLLFAPIKKARNDFIIEKATELGVAVISPVITDYTQNKRLRVDRMELLAIEAAEQTERLDLPKIYDEMSLTAALEAWPTDVPLFYCDEAGDTKPMINALEQYTNLSAGILIGPEGGFSPNERELLRSLDFVTPVTLGPRILRAETAVVSALTLWQSQVGDWQKQPYLPKN
ncbi:MAG: 16S rRNA (uracil(1498)-N(3))-methyltransferase [Henriciella sp.]|nr:16S rRNA (uracil(1498)-N(3))-methyltransferase [Henriciella sp.]